jgi:hypothetical protein
MEFSLQAPNAYKSHDKMNLVDPNKTFQNSFLLEVVGLSKSAAQRTAS